MYRVVLFLDTNEVEVVPNTWIKTVGKGLLCYWPPWSPEEILKAVKARERVHDSWPAFRIRSICCAGILY